MKTQQPTAHAGDLVTVPAAHVGEHARHGTILEVVGTEEHPRYRVKWDDGRETVLSPEAGATVTHVPDTAA